MEPSHEATAHAEAEVKCVRCGSTTGPQILLDDGWTCLRHLPKIGERRLIGGRAR